MRKLFILFAVSFILSCNSDSSPEHTLTGYFHDYAVVMGDNPARNALVTATFHKGDEFSKAAKLPEDYVILLDGKPLPINTDVYPSYTMEAPRDSFPGNHIWKLVYKDETVFEFPFKFTSFRILDTIPPVIGSKDLVLRTEGLADERKIECWFDDAAMENEEDRFSYPIQNSTVTISAADMKKLKPGNYNLKISFIQLTPLQLHGKEIGKSDVTYMLEPVSVRVNE